MDKLAVTLCAAALICVQNAHAQQTTFPFLQDGGARDSFVRGAISTCLKTQTAAPENKDIGQDQIAKFCTCYARAIADIINAQEYEAMIVSEVPESFLRKGKAASTLCAGRQLN